MSEPVYASVMLGLSIVGVPVSIFMFIIAIGILNKGIFQISKTHRVKQPYVKPLAFMLILGAISYWVVSPFAIYLVALVVSIIGNMNSEKK